MIGVAAFFHVLNSILEALWAFRTKRLKKKIRRDIDTEAKKRNENILKRAQDTRHLERRRNSALDSLFEDDGFRRD